MATAAAKDFLKDLAEAMKSDASVMAQLRSGRLPLSALLQDAALTLDASSPVRVALLERAHESALRLADLLGLSSEPDAKRAKQVEEDALGELHTAHGVKHGCAWVAEHGGPIDDLLRLLVSSATHDAAREAIAAINSAAASGAKLTFRECQRLCAAVQYATRNMEGGAAAEQILTLYFGAVLPQTEDQHSVQSHNEWLDLATRVLDVAHARARQDDAVPNSYFDLAAATCAQLLELRMRGDAPLDQMVSLLHVIFSKSPEHALDALLQTSTPQRPAAQHMLGSLLAAVLRQPLSLDKPPVYLRAALCYRRALRLNVAASTKHALQKRASRLLPTPNFSAWLSRQDGRLAEELCAKKSLSAMARAILHCDDDTCEALMDLLTTTEELAGRAAEDKEGGQPLFFLDEGPAAEAS